MIDTFDFIIVGAGTAGCVLANRLSAKPSHRVLLLEAGPSGHLLTRVPIGYAGLVDNPRTDWRYRSEPEDATCGRQIAVPRGKIIGGSSAINGHVYVRGQRGDFDAWADQGNDGWGYDDILPYYRRLERFEGVDDGLRGRNGPVGISTVSESNPFYEALQAAGRELGVPGNPDYNGQNLEGICRTQATISGARRSSAAVCYLDPARRRPNLVIRAGAQVQRLTFNGKRCTGVEYLSGNSRNTVLARKEVILCAGVVNSPQLLELSGIGQADLLREKGIPVIHELPGVGENLRDHFAPRLTFKSSKPGTSYNRKGRGLGLLMEVCKYALSGTGLLSLPTAPMVGFLKTRPDLTAPDIQVHFVPFRVELKNNKRRMGREPAFNCTVHQCRPESTGSIHIKSSNPQEPPAIRFNFLSVESDKRALIDGMRAVRKVMQSEAMRGMVGEEIQPGASVQSDDELLEYIRKVAETAYHPVGTCKMGKDPMAVVDDRLRVHGVVALRVADGSIMPGLTSGNTAAPCFMIGEKASDLVLADHP